MKGGSPGQNNGSKYSPKYVELLRVYNILCRDIKRKDIDESRLKNMI